MNNSKEIQNSEKLRLSNQELNKITKESLQEALIILASEVPFESITISQLVKKAGVSRQAFYRNYSTKEDIITQMNAAIINLIFKALTSDNFTKNSYKFFFNIFSGVKENSKIFLLSLKARTFEKFLLDFDPIINSVSPPTERYKFATVVGGFINILLNWLTNGMQESVEDMAQLCLDIFKTESWTN